MSGALRHRLRELAAARQTLHALRGAWRRAQPPLNRLQWWWWERGRVPRRPVASEAVTLLQIGAQRVGHHLLTAYLESVPAVSHRDALLHPPDLKRDGAPLRGDWPIFSSGRAAARALVAGLGGGSGPRVARLELKPLARARLSPTALRRALPAARLLLLYRRDLAAQYVSLLVATRTRRWQRLAGEPEAQEFSGTVRIDPGAFQRHCDELRDGYRAYLAAGFERIALVSYEELTADPQRVFDEKLFALLEQPRCRVSNARFLKQGRRPLSAVVENYAELRAVLESARLELEPVPVT